MVWFRKTFGSGASAETNPLIQRIEDLLRDDALYEADEPRPAKSTVNEAKALIVDSLDLIHRFGFGDPDIHPADGAIRIIWTHGEKTLKLIIPPHGGPYLFHKEQKQYASEKATHRTMASWLTWLSGVSATMSSSR